MPSSVGGPPAIAVMSSMLRRFAKRRATLLTALVCLHVAAAVATLSGTAFLSAARRCQQQEHSLSDPPSSRETLMSRRSLFSTLGSLFAIGTSVTAAPQRASADLLNMRTQSRFDGSFEDANYTCGKCYRTISTVSIQVQRLH
eukprot:TRINITY_DN34805_c0_g1_i2.p1 TRINITY_DN34805_c0_g1~~TRINITY_DN34805_c0_g1_i2.p1  ORF type:complete len:143 (-),score=14.61 TRINITY_DN34805_c0_g1_i2:417-845(-)